jgi:uncharacterized protein (TIGR04255 family)
MSDNKDMLLNIENSPIFLAILEIRYIDSKLKDIEKLSVFKNDLVNLFPNFQKQITSQLKLDNLLEGQTSIQVQNQKIDCFLYSSIDRQSEFTISLNMFNYRQSGIYTNFEDFTKKVKTAWEIHHRLLNEAVITGISLRCFNKIEIVEEVKDPSEYFNISIQAGQDVIKDEVVNYSIRYITKNINDNRHSIIALSLEDRIQNVFPFVLDIDVHDDNPINNDLELLWEKFETLRIEKDRIFDSLLTEKTKKIYV